MSKPEIKVCIYHTKIWDLESDKREEKKTVGQPEASFLRSQIRTIFKTCSSFGFPFNGFPLDSINIFLYLMVVI